MLHRFRHSIASFSLPTRLNNPFHYTPHPLCELAARELRAYLCERKEWTEELSAGKMFGVLVVKDPAGTVGFLAAFSGNLAGSNSHEYFVPPIYDMLRPGDFFRTEEASISDLNRQIETLETAGRYRELLRTIEETETEVAREIAAAKARMRIAKTAREARRREHPDENTQTALVRESQYEKAELHRLKQSWKIGSHRFTRNEPPSRNESNPCAASVRPVLRLFRQTISQVPSAQRPRRDTRSGGNIRTDSAGYTPGRCRGVCGPQTAAIRFRTPAYTAGDRRILVGSLAEGRNPPSRTLLSRLPR